LDAKHFSHPLAYEDGTDTVNETSDIKHHTPENNPKVYTRHSEHGESLKSRIICSVREELNI
jgi:hypothetical protein